MKRISFFVLPLFLLINALCLFVHTSYAGDKKPRQEFYEIKVYHLKNADQEKIVDDYLQHALLPALHKTGIAKVGVFKPLTNDTAADKLIYVFMPMNSMDQLLSLPGQLDKDAEYHTAGSNYFNAVYTNPPYTRMESILLRAFRMAPQMQLPKLTGPKPDRIYELRSYESPTEKLYINKVHMFNEGGEVPLFEHLGFNAVFYADVINGSHMPNLMYMTSFENKTVHDEKWKTFSNDPEWKKLSSMPEYQHNVSKADIILMHATDYSDIY
jgi:hypothetical protein